MPIPLTPQLTVFRTRVAEMNFGLFTLAGRRVLIDPGGLQEDADALLAVMAGQKPDMLVITHSHWDHILGARYFQEVMVIVQQRFTTTAEAGRLYMAKAMAGAALLPKAGKFHLPVPELLVDQQMEIGEGDELLRLVHTPGHAPDHLSLFHPASGALWAGDLLSDVEVPSVIDSFADYERTLQRLAELAPQLKILVPGHGSPTSSPVEILRRLHTDRAYLAALRERITPAHGQGLPAALRACEDLLSAYPDGNAEAHRNNVEKIYVELGGKTDGKVGWERMVEVFTKQ
jgi:glyoxylase-like metal-dependent hydrolase (beta-lactamase superfamily II)